MESTFEGKVVSARFSQYLTDKYGDKEANISGYTLHILIDKINGESINKHCFELQCYSDFIIKTGNKITYLHLIKPIYEDKGIPTVSEPDIAVGESIVAIKGVGGLKRKIKHGKEYRMARTGLPMCVITRPLISDIWIEDKTDEQEDEGTSNIRINLMNLTTSSNV